MPSLTIRNIPEDVLDILRKRAQRNHRSLNGEILAVLESSARIPTVDPGAAIREVREIRRRYDVPTVDHAEIDEIKRRGRQE